jgi:hypothetical protein
MDRLNQDRLWAFGGSFSNDQMNPRGARLASMSTYRISEHSSRGWHPFAQKAEVAERSPKTMGFEEQAEL